MAILVNEYDLRMSHVYVAYRTFFNKDKTSLFYPQKLQLSKLQREICNKPMNKNTTTQRNHIRHRVMPKLIHLQKHPSHSQPGTSHRPASAYLHT